MNNAGTGAEDWRNFVRNRGGAAATARNFEPNYASSTYVDGVKDYTKTGQAVFTAAFSWRMFAASTKSGTKYGKWNEQDTDSNLAHTSVGTSGGWIHTKNLEQMTDDELDKMFKATTATSKLADIYTYTGTANNQWRTQTIDSVKLVATMDNKASVEQVQEYPTSNIDTSANLANSNKNICLLYTSPSPRD